MALTDGILPHGGSPRPASNLVAKHRDATIRSAKVLQAVDRDRALRHLGLVITGVALGELIGIRSELAGEHEVAVGPPGRRDTFALAHMAESMNMVSESSTGTIHRLIIGPLNACSSRPSSQIGATCCKLGRIASTIRAQILSPTRRVAM